MAQLFSDDDAVCIVKLTRKPKPKVVAKLVTIQRAHGSCVCCSKPGELRDWYEKRHYWMIPRQGKLIRVTTEELADE